MSSHARPWPMFHQNPQHTGLSSFVGPSTPILKWKFTTLGPVISSPAIASGTIYIGSVDGNLYALNRDGALKWKFSTGGRIESSPAVGSRGTIYVGSMDGYLYAINPHGTLEWKIRIPFLGSTTSPTVWSDGTIYVGADQYIFSINPHGYVNWNLTTNSGGGTYDSPAVGFDGTIYIGVDDPELEAVYPNGTMRWVNNDCLCPVDRKSTRLNSSHLGISYAVFCLKKKKTHSIQTKKCQISRERLYT